MLGFRAMTWTAIVPRALCAVLLTAPAAHADVVDVASNGFSVKILTEIAAPAPTVYAALPQVASWWDPAHTWSGDAKNLSLDTRAGGCFCERLPNGSVQHMTLVYADGRSTFRLIGGLGPLQSMAVTGALTFVTRDNAGRTVLELTYNVGGYAQGGLAPLAAVVDGVLAGQMKRLKSFVETGRAQ